MIEIAIRPDEADRDLYDFFISFLDKNSNNEGNELRFSQEGTYFSYEEGLEIAIKLAEVCIPAIVAKSK